MGTQQYNQNSNSPQIMSDECGSARHKRANMVPDVREIPIFEIREDSSIDGNFSILEGVRRRHSTLHPIYTA